MQWFAMQRPGWTSRWSKSIICLKPHLHHLPYASSTSLVQVQLDQIHTSLICINLKLPLSHTFPKTNPFSAPFPHTFVLTSRSVESEFELGKVIEDIIRRAVLWCNVEMWALCAWSVRMIRVGHKNNFAVDTLFHSKVYTWTGSSIDERIHQFSKPWENGGPQADRLSHKHTSDSSLSLVSRSDIVS